MDENAKLEQDRLEIVKIMKAYELALISREDAIVLIERRGYFDGDQLFRIFFTLLLTTLRDSGRIDHDRDTIKQNPKG